ncbi:MAG: hypothetical protein Q8P48_04700 [Deltaproteobacteria bacterium]|nr:hypothetical protein [Deltaproteobacteria bacterium]
MDLFSESTLMLLGAFAIFLIIASGTILVLWIAMPFSVFGMKDLLKRSIQEQEKTNKLLRSLLETSLYREAPYGEKDEAPEKRENTH